MKRFERILPFVILLTLAAYGISAGRARTTPKDLVMAGTGSRTLENGLKIIVREQHGTPLVAIDLWVRAGSGAENEKEVGAAHFLEHMLFKGTGSRKKGEIDEAIEDLGSSLSAGTTRDGAHFYATVATQYLPKALDVIADVVQNATLPASEMELERKVILDELARDRNDWRKQAADAVRSALYPNASYGRQILGTPEAIRALSRETAEEFYRRNYRPNNATLVIVGDIGLEAAAAASARTFGTWKASEVPVPPELPSKVTKRETEISGLTIQTTVAIGFPGPAGDNERAVCAADIVTALLDDGPSSRLSPALKGLASPGEFGADYLTLKRPSSIAIFATSSKAEPGKLIKAMEGEAARISVGLLSQGELDYAKRRILGNYLYGIETYAGQARELGMADLYGKYDFAMRYPALVKSITASEIQLFAKSHLDPESEVRATLRSRSAGP